MAAVLCLASATLANNEAMEKWSEHHPEASKALGAWVKAHPQAAAKIFEWDGHHPERSQAFVTWAVDHPSEPIEKYVHEHPDESVLDEIMKGHHLAAVEFMAWCRVHAEAARALMAHPKGLEWAGHHLYKEYWNLENK
jgi:hypothetical protein